jgi:hypothetical protein
MNPELNLGGHPERIKLEGVKVDGNQLAKIGDFVVAIADLGTTIKKGQCLKVLNIIIEPKGNERGFDKFLVFEGIDGDYNPRKFKLKKEIL